MAFAFVVHAELATMDPLTRERGPRLMPAALNDDQNQARVSLDVLTGLDAEVLLPGHGDPWTKAPGDAVDLAREADQACSGA